MVTADEGNWYFLQILPVVNALKTRVDSSTVFGVGEYEKRKILPDRRMYDRRFLALQQTVDEVRIYECRYTANDVGLLLLYRSDM